MNSRMPLEHLSLKYLAGRSLLIVLHIFAVAVGVAVVVAVEIQQAIDITFR